METKRGKAEMVWTCRRSKTTAIRGYNVKGIEMRIIWKLMYSLVDGYQKKIERVIFNILYLITYLIITAKIETGWKRGLSNRAFSRTCSTGTEQ